MKIFTSASGHSRQMTASTAINATAISAATRNVPRTRSGSRAPKFWPATGLTEKPSATTGMKPAWMTRRPMPNPAWAAAPNPRVIA